MDESEFPDDPKSVESMKQIQQDMEGAPAGTPNVRFQRTDQWRPVYSWLESLDMDEVVNSKDIADWLSDNPQIREELYQKHSRYHLMHYIKKCRTKILKKKEKKGTELSSKASIKVQYSGVTREPTLLQCNNVKSYPKDSSLYVAKRTEAFQKYEILVDLEKQLSAILPKH